MPGGLCLRGPGCVLVGGVTRGLHGRRASLLLYRKYFSHLVVILIFVFSQGLVVAFNHARLVE